MPDIFTSAHRDLIISLATKYRLPAVSWTHPFAAEGGLMSYGVDVLDLFRRAASYVDRLKSLGWIDGQTVKLEFRWAEGRPELHTQFAQELAKLNPSVMFAGGNELAAITKITSIIPTVFLSNDALGGGVVKSLARSGGNITGITLQTLDIANKRFEPLRETVPSMRRLTPMSETGAFSSLTTPSRELRGGTGVSAVRAVGAAVA
jgi:putative ABC transport system substrate-binding protein